MRPPTKEWIEKAEEDWRAAIRLGRGRKPLFNSVCFHAQQCVEKYLKAFLEENNLPIHRTHDLGVLLKELPPQLAELVLIKDELEDLTSYSVSFRYPGEDADLAQARAARKTAARVRELVRMKLRLPNHK